MNNNDIKLIETIDDVMKKIDININNISEILKNMYEGVLTLDETKWNTKEKKKYQAEFLPYLQKVSTKYPIYLNRRFKVLKEAVVKYRDVDIDYKNKANTTLY